MSVHKGNLLRVQAWPVSQMICFRPIWLLHIFYYWYLSSLMGMESTGTIKLLREAKLLVQIIFIYSVYVIVHNLQ